MAEVSHHDVSTDLPVFRNIYIHDEATDPEPAKLFKDHYEQIKTGQMVLVKRRLSVMVTERASGNTKQEHTIEYDVVPVCDDIDWWARSPSCCMSFHHKGRLNGKGISIWSFLPNDRSNRFRILACHQDVLAAHGLD